MAYVIRDNRVRVEILEVVEEIDSDYQSVIVWVEDTKEKKRKEKGKKEEE